LIEFIYNASNFDNKKEKQIFRPIKIEEFYDKTTKKLASKAENKYNLVNKYCFKDEIVDKYIM